ncbi:unnamed protein product [Arctogadus glacialis]
MLCVLRSLRVSAPHPDPGAARTICQIIMTPAVIVEDPPPEAGEQLPNILEEENEDEPEGSKGCQRAPQRASTGSQRDINMVEISRTPMA